MAWELKFKNLSLLFNVLLLRSILSTRAPKSVKYRDRIAGKDDSYEMSMLEIALTAAESQKLMEESWDNGVNDNFISGRGRVL